MVIFFDSDSATHADVKAFMVKYVKPAKMAFYTMARENYMSETFHSVMGKFATKRIHFPASHDARLFCAALDWNENIGHPVWKIYSRERVSTAVRARPARVRVMVEPTRCWKECTSRRLYGASHTS